MLMWEKPKRMEEEALLGKDTVIKTKVCIKQLESPAFFYYAYDLHPPTSYVSCTKGSLNKSNKHGSMSKKWLRKLVDTLKKYMGHFFTLR